MKAGVKLFASQKKLLVLSALLAAVVGFLAIPFLTRLLGVEVFSALMALFLILNSFRWLDFLKPVLVYIFSEFGDDKVRVKEASILSFLYGTIFCALIGAAVSYFYSKQFDFYSLLLLVGSGVAYFMASVPWAVMESKGKQGFAQFCYSFMMFLIYLFSVSFAFYFDDIIFFSALVFFIYWTFSVFLWVYVFSEVDFRSDLNFFKGALNKLMNTFFVNIFKLVSDYFDRLLVGKFMGAASAGAYLLSYELLSKSNLVSGYVNVYFYPLLCRRKGGEGYSSLLNKVTFIGAVSALAIQFVALIFVFWAEDFLGWYAGQEYARYGSYFPVLLTGFSLYSLAFYYQSYFRSSNNFIICSISFGFSCLSGLVWVLFNLDDISVNVIFVAFLLFKSSGFLMWCFSLYYSYGRDRMVDLIWVLYYVVAGFVLYASIGSYAYVIFLFYVISFVSVSMFILGKSGASKYEL